MLRLIDTWGKYFQYLVEIFRFRDKINFNILCDVAADKHCCSHDRNGLDFYFSLPLIFEQNSSWYQK
jgi:hypothetical protein